MSKQKSTEKETPEEIVKDGVDDNAVQPTVSAGPEGDEDTGLKSVNIPLSASNALTPDGGVKVAVDADLTEEVLQTDAYDPSKTKAQAVLTEDAEVDEKVSKKKYDQLLAAFEEVLSGHTFDVVHADFYRTQAGVKKPL